MLIKLRLLWVGYHPSMFKLYPVLRTFVPPQISVGRTVREFIAGTMAAPVVYVFMWLVIFGGAGMRLEREAAANGLCCHNIGTQQ